ncbi:MAG TPA: IS200/IS605 family transposase [Chitinophagaceae bacterium]
MANTYTQIHIQSVFAVKFRLAMIEPLWKTELHKYITDILQGNDHKMIAINSMPDHMHMLFGFRPTQSLSELMQFVKGGSSKWINDNNLTNSLFRWQGGFGAFSYSKSQLDRVAKYIHNQERHHKKKPFLEEYKNILDGFGVNYDDRYIFKPLE